MSMLPPSPFLTEPIHSSCGGVESRHTGAWTTPSTSPVAGVAPGSHEAIPSNEGRPEEASAPAPTKNPDADALDLTDCISEIFFYARKLMKQPPRFILDEAAFMAEVEETPLFLREHGYLQRREA